MNLSKKEQLLNLSIIELLLMNDYTHLSSENTERNYLLFRNKKKQTEHIVFIHLSEHKNQVQYLYFDNYLNQGNQEHLYATIEKLDLLNHLLISTPVQQLYQKYSLEFIDIPPPNITKYKLLFNNYINAKKNNGTERLSTHTYINASTKELMLPLYHLDKSTFTLTNIAYYNTELLILDRYHNTNPGIFIETKSIENIEEIYLLPSIEHYFHEGNLYTDNNRTYACLYYLCYQDFCLLVNNLSHVNIKIDESNSDLLLHCISNHINTHTTSTVLTETTTNIKIYLTNINRINIINHLKNVTTFLLHKYHITPTVNVQQTKGYLLLESSNNPLNVIALLNTIYYNLSLNEKESCFDYSDINFLREDYNQQYLLTEQVRIAQANKTEQEKREKQTESTKKVNEETTAIEQPPANNPHEQNKTADTTPNELEHETEPSDTETETDIEESEEEDFDFSTETTEDTFTTIVTTNITDKLESLNSDYDPEL